MMELEECRARTRMVEDLLPYFPQAMTMASVCACVAVLAAGVMLWLVGGVWARGIVTLVAVTLGGWLGMMLPRWYIWPVNSMSLSVLGAVGLGVCAFAVPRVWVGVVLGAVLAGWASLAAWMTCRGDAGFAYRSEWEVQNLTLPQHLVDIWGRLPETVTRVAPYAAAAGMVSGLAIALLWPRLSRALAFSAAGVTVTFVSLLMVVTTRRPDWLLLVPTQTEIQAAVLGVMALAGVVIQWQVIPVAKKDRAGAGAAGCEMERRLDMQPSQPHAQHPVARPTAVV
jgi:hypothetical protein